MKITLTLRAWAGILLLAIAILVLGYIYIVPQYWYSNGQYDRLIARYPAHPRTAEALIHRVIQADPTSDDYIYIGPNGYGSSSSEADADPEATLEIVLRMMSDFPEHPWSRQHGEWMLAHLYRKIGDWDQARALFERIAKSDTMHQAQAAEMTEAFTPQLQQDRQPSVTGVVRIGQDTAQQVFVYLMPKDANHWYSPPNGHYPMTVPDEQGVYRFYDIDPGDYEVGVGVDAQAIKGYVRSEEKVNYAAVQADGTCEFHIHFVPQARVLQPANREVIQGDRIQFQWEPYPGAAHYSIGIGEIRTDETGQTTGSSSVLLEEKWPDTSAEYSLKDLRDRFFGRLISKDSQGLSPSSVLGIVYPGGQFTWYIHAYDRDGLQISSSSGYYSDKTDRLPLFTWDSKGQLEGDKLVVKRDYTSAVSAYETEGDNPYALRALAMIALEGISLNERGDPAAALAYMKRIAQPTENDQELIKRLEQEAAK